MRRDTFIQLYNKYQSLIFDSLRKASDIHSSENQKYGIFDYSTHLVEVLGKVYEYGHDICEDEKDIIIVAVSACFHDILEDTRTSYHDLKNILISELFLISTADKISDIVYAVTTPLGKTRSERHCPAYYEKIRNCKFASFVKVADRLANMKMCAIYDSSKLRMYIKEMDKFDIDFSEIPGDMLTELNSY